ncbi:hypothetical protein [Ciceribacter thiooxidans]|uniref:Uncharacterized protein n=1 Tax=Ciceribacter thiooxidans TaxID=1969821 RepID=A0ABV7I4K4_9HYPH|nr:hypothetical protein [Ciceribacter thiooxidans]MDI6834241.1 hypothetical protein [Rhizobiaceae bacterium]HLP66677.1 hypothetical protein [Rhizobium sp.]
MAKPEEAQSAGWFDGLLRTLARLGILRYGGKAAVYHSGSERPTEFLMPDVLNAERDMPPMKELGAASKQDKTEKG